VLLGEESERPCERPPLSKGYLMGKEERETVYVHPAEWYAEHDADLRLGVTVTSIDRLDMRWSSLTAGCSDVHFRAEVIAARCTGGRSPAVLRRTMRRGTRATTGACA
jgi:hypothetical protein